MTLEHLRIVNEGVGGTIQTLAAGKVPEGVVRTAAVKPSPGVSGRVVDSFSTGCESYLQIVAGLHDLRTVQQHAHPWFGSLDAAGWHAMVAFHMRLHRKQLGAILTALA